ncbi:plastocyanin/azurin family copper-binding protein [Halopelagius longus]|uniref:Copper-binding protein n=1 Tax=Halopelagius longus TaxID=1236180 RepID=A0A1H1GSL1_9EURY|nr:plastocyanin/azurin family copper-binding protein [Halopelagius longus]RDI69588.1 copper-binding protein [Halopelagius longus]SDR16222.1 Tat (twin-arginine translocation) pathway signal sequence [Halopelagius longus]
MTHKTNRRTFLQKVGVTAGAVATAGCLSGGDRSPRTIGMQGTDFSPATVTITTGASLRWKNTSDIEHTVTAYEEKIPDDAAYFASGGFDSERAARNNVTGGLIAPGETYEHTFEVTGRYKCFCIPHESSGMVGTVKVE